MKNLFDTSQLCCLLIIILAFNTFPQVNEVNTFMNDLIYSGKISGASIAVRKNNEWIFKKNYGYSDLGLKKPVVDTTLFGIMSITKIFTAFAVIQLADQNKLNLDDPVINYLPDLPEQFKDVKIYQLLNHSSGIPDYVKVKDYFKSADKTQTPMQVLSTILNQPLEFIPGEKNKYSNSGYFILGLLIEKVSGKSLEDYFNKNIFNPLQMDNTCLETTASNLTNKAKGYFLKDGKLEEVKNLNPSQYWAAGGIVSTINDLIKWNDALFSGGILPLKQIQKMMQPEKLLNGIYSEYGIGFELMNAPGLKIVGNNGVGIGYNAADLMFPDDSLIIIVLTNTSNGNSTMIAKSIRDMLCKETETTENVEDKIQNDELDSLVLNVFTNVYNNNLSKDNFQDDEAYNKFIDSQLNFIKSCGKPLSVINKGEKLNPQSIVRRYEVKSASGITNWIIIFSKEKKILLTNHM